MPWKETCVMDTRLEFVMRTLAEGTDFGRLCNEYDISRKTGYKWKERFLARGCAGLEDLSRRPKSSPNQLSEDVVCEIIRIKMARESWGPRKVREVYGRKHPMLQLPSDSTFKRVLDKAGLVKKRRRKAADSCGRIENRIIPDAPNDLWTVDFKGWWYTGDRQRCEPLTVRDDFSRFVLCANPLADAKGITVRHQFERLFKTFGLPNAIRSDNGTPFACTQAPLGLSRLSAWWVALGINLDRIPPARPDQNGGHERMHRDIAMEVERCPETNVKQQRAALETWRHIFNYERPHEALGMDVPSNIYRRSEHKWTEQDQELSYPTNFLKRKVSNSGWIKIYGTPIRISTALSGWHVGLRTMENQQYLVHFGALLLGTIDTRTDTFKTVSKH